MSKLLRTLEPRVVIAVAIAFLLLVAAALGASAATGRLERAESVRLNVEQQLADGQKLVENMFGLGFEDAAEIAAAVRAMESAIPEAVDDLSLTRRVSASALVNALTFEQWEALQPIRLDDNVSVVPYQFRVRGELSGINGFLDNLSTAAGHPVTYRDIRIDGTSDGGLVFGVDILASGVVDIWIYTGPRVVAGSIATEPEGTVAPAPAAPEAAESLEPEGPETETENAEGGEERPEQDDTEDAQDEGTLTG